MIVIISIHVSRMEMRLLTPFKDLLFESFNPRTPYGDATDQAPVLGLGDADFNPRTPYGDATALGTADSCMYGHFNPRTPYGDATTSTQVSIYLLTISIHAPRMGMRLHNSTFYSFFHTILLIVYHVLSPMYIFGRF